MIEAAVKKPRVQVLDRLRAGETPFLAWGYSCLKVVRQELDPETNEFGGEEIELRVPIKSTGLAEVMEGIARDIPTPPQRREFIKPGSDEARSLGLGKDGKIVIVEDTTDSGYKEQLRQHNTNAMYKMILAGLDMDIYDHDVNNNDVLVVRSNGRGKPTEVIDRDKAIVILKSQGISNEQFEQLYSDIKSLTETEQRRIDRESGRL